jgi:hypothetical protein
MVLGSTKDVTEINTRIISWGEGKGGRCVGLTTLQPSCGDYPEMWESQARAALKACPGIALNLLIAL